MLDGNPTGIIVASSFLISATTVIKNVHKQSDNVIKPIVFGFVLCMSLLAIGFVAPGFASGLAIMGIVGAFVLNGPTLFQLLQAL